MVDAIKYIFKSIIIGIAALIIINIIGQIMHFRLPITILAILLIGFLRIPGLLIYLLYLVL